MLNDRTLDFDMRVLKVNSLVRYMYTYLLHNWQSAEWFGEDGNLLALPDPMNDSVLRPVIPEQITEPALQTEFKQVHVHVV